MCVCTRIAAKHHSRSTVINHPRNNFKRIDRLRKVFIIIVFVIIRVCANELDLRPLLFVLLLLVVVIIVVVLMK